VQPVGDALVLYSEDGERHWGCRACGHELGSAETDYKPHLATRTRVPHEVDATLYLDASEFCDAPMTLVEQICPHCGELLNTDIHPLGAAPVRDVRLAPAPAEVPA
jgi:acetone carboxylase gamma subunit